MIVKALHPSIDGNPRSNLTAKANAGQANIVVQNVSDFSVDDPIIIGTPGQELTEIKKISSISGKTITLSANLDNTHPENTRITYIKYDQVKFYKSDSEDGTYTEAETKDIAIDEPHTLYSSPLSYYFKIAYYNSITAELSGYSVAVSSSGFERYSLIKLQDALFKKFRDEKEQFLERDEITTWIGEIKDDMVNKIIDNNEKYFNASVDLDVNSDGEADLSDDFRKFQKISVLYNGITAIRASKIELENVDDATQTFSESAPYYYFNSYKIGIRPKGIVGTTKVRVVHEYQPADLENDSDLLPKPIRFYTKVVMDGLMVRACEKAGKDSRADRYERKYVNGVDDMIEEVNNLVLNENRGVEDDDITIY